jgi:pimeloyl-ACP methyl ester carboxylesterase
VLPTTRLVMVPGLGLGPEAWSPTIRALAGLGFDADSMVAAPLPGYGWSAGRHEDLDPAQLARRLVDQALAAGERHLLLGHSASCQVVAHAAALTPDRVVGLILVGPTTDPRARTWPSLVARWCATARHEPPWQVPTLVRQYTRTGLVTMLRAMNAARRDRIDVVLRRLACPVLVLRGVEDRIVPADWAEVLVADAREAFTVTLPAGGHMVPLTQPELVAPAIAEFLAGRFA